MEVLKPLPLPCMSSYDPVATPLSLPPSLTASAFWLLHGKQPLLPYVSAVQAFYLTIGSKGPRNSKTMK